MLFSGQSECTIESIVTIEIHFYRVISTFLNDQAVSLLDQFDFSETMTFKHMTDFEECVREKEREKRERVRVGNKN